MTQEKVGIRSRTWYNAGLMLIGSVIAALASFALSVDALILARTPRATLGCDVNGRISCSSVAASWQSNLVHIWGTSVPNAFFGLLAMGVFIGFTAALAFGFRPNRTVTILFTLGMIACVAFAGWLLGVSVFALRILCPWCLTMDVGIILQSIGFVRWRALLDDDDRRHPIVSGPISLGIEAVPLLALALIVALHM